MPDQASPHGALPRLAIRRGEERRVQAGYPWVFGNELEMDAGAKALPTGSLVALHAADGRALGTATFNRHSLISARVLERGGATVDAGWLAQRLERALALRTRFFPSAFYRLVHAEGDHMPGLVVDRYGDVLSVQANTAGMDRLMPKLEAAFAEVLAPATVVWRNDASARALEGLERTVTVSGRPVDGPVVIEEGGIGFAVDPVHGQKTGWYFDLESARTLVAGLARGQRVLDLYCNAGAFALRCAKAGGSVLGIDGSALALDLARASAARNGLAAEFAQADVFTWLETAPAGAYDLVIADPPSFVKSRKELASGVRGYRKLARMAARVLAPGGILFIASCSHHVAADAFAEEVRRGLAAAERPARILAAGGAGPDHPVHPALPESAYLKWQVLALD
ncbi:class I SAM-dependent rRNA methyltransferase [Zavarzinia sp. CC-PAN008]|uniref:class I SAM-dependent rRNA methyltransferase n=1 Tax=Zavarzinia sp. CC-PAN008 TaxID=3243332 RepID=UPI003F7435D9